MMYETYFELPLNGYWNWWLAIPVVMLALGISFFYFDRFRKLNKEILPISFPLFLYVKNFAYSKKFAYFWIGGVALLGSLGFYSVYSEYFKAREALTSGNVSVVEGVIHDYKAGTNNKGSAFDTFCVKEVCFEVSDYEVTSGFHQMQINGSPLKDGLPVRISYTGDTIVRVEIGSQR